AVLGLLAAIALILFSINQYDAWKVKRKKRLIQLSNKELESKIREWINIPAWSVQPQSQLKGILFAYSIQHGGLHVAIVRDAEEPSVIALVSKFTMPSEEAALYKGEWGRFRGQLSIEMARLGIQWHFIGPQNKFEAIELAEQVILDDAVTGYYFRSRVLFVLRAGILVMELWKEALRLSGKSVSDGEGSQSQ
ncbi:MAG: hypothetical protein AAB037_01180, partial [Chloroflexota bacterium]